MEIRAKIVIVAKVYEERFGWDIKTLHWVVPRDEDSEAGLRYTILVLKIDFKEVVHLICA